MLEFSQFIGPVGGMLCIAWGMGALSGWAFRGKTDAKLTELKDKSCEEKIATLQAENNQLATRLAIIEARMISALGDKNDKE